MQHVVLKNVARCCERLARPLECPTCYKYTDYETYLTAKKSSFESVHTWLKLPAFSNSSIS